MKFQKVWSISSAIQKGVDVDLHPSFVSGKYHFLARSKTFADVKLQVAEKFPEIRLTQHRLYPHEFVTCPPLRELRILIKEDDGPIQHGDVAYRVCRTVFRLL